MKKLMKKITAILLLVCFLIMDVGQVYANEYEAAESLLSESESESESEEAESIVETETVNGDGESEETQETESNQGENAEETTDLGQETELESDILEETATETESEITEEAETETETAEESETEIQIITGFVGLNESERDIYISNLDKPSLKQLVGIMPKKLQVYLDGSDQIAEIEVEWFCVNDDYENSALYYYQFSPIFGENYTLSEEIDLLKEVPYIGVFFYEEKVKALSVADSSANETEIFNFLTKQMGLNSAAASGILANIYCESGFNPTAGGDGGTSYGICQWHDKRKESLIQYCKDNGYDYTSVNGQLNYLRYELVNKYPTVYKYMLNVSDTEDGAYNAGYYWCYNFEIPANTEKTSIIRGNLAKNEYWPKYASSVLTPSLSSVTNTINGILVKWNAVANADGYRVYRRTNGGDWERIAIIKDGGTIEYSDTSVKSGTKYTYTIRASLGDTLSNYNSGLGILYLKTPDVAASAAAGGIKVTWEKIIGADGYRVYRKTKGGGWTRVADIKGGSIVTYTDKSVSNSSTYTYTVRANSGSTLSDYQPGASVSYLKAPDVAGVSKVSGGVKVTWGKITGADGYRVYRRTNGGDWVRIADLKGGSTVTYMDESVSSGSKYTYTVRAYSGSTLSGYESGKSIIYLKDPNVTGVSAVCGGAKVTWEKITGADGYRVYRRTNGGGWIRIADLKGGSTVTYTDDSVSSGSKYTYTVRAYLGSTLSGYESGESILYLKDPNVTGVSAVSDGVKVAWEKITGAEGYYVYRRTNGGNWERIVAIRSGYMVTYTDKSATSGSTYTYTVRAYSGSTLSAYQSGAKILYLKDPNVTGASAISGGVGVTWEKISGATGYRVYRRTNGSDWTRIADIKSGSTVAYVDTSVTSGSTYTYTVRACSGNTLSCYKSQKKVIYLSVPALSGAEEAGGNINVTWKKVNGASGYYIYRKTNGGGWSRIGTVKGGSTLRYADTSVSQGAIYTYTVRAYNGSSLSYYETDGVSGTLQHSFSKYTTTEAVNYRTGPGTTYSIAGSLSRGTSVQVVPGYSMAANGYTWYKIYLNNQYYYIASNYLER